MDLKLQSLTIAPANPYSTDPEKKKQYRAMMKVDVNSTIMEIVLPPEAAKQILDAASRVIVEAARESTQAFQNQVEESFGLLINGPDA